jgi:hypothetical protein
MLKKSKIYKSQEWARVVNTVSKVFGVGVVDV